MRREMVRTWLIVGVVVVLIVAIGVQEGRLAPRCDAACAALNFSDGEVRGSLTPAPWCVCRQSLAMPVGAPG